MLELIPAYRPYSGPQTVPKTKQNSGYALGLVVIVGSMMCVKWVYYRNGTLSRSVTRPHRSFCLYYFFTGVFLFSLYLATITLLISLYTLDQQIAAMPSNRPSDLSTSITPHLALCDRLPSSVGLVVIYYKPAAMFAVCASVYI